MFSLFAGLWEWLFSKPSLKFLVLGLDNAGKTTTLEVLKILKGQQPLAPCLVTPTVGLNLAKVDRDGVHAFFWDLGGQQALRRLWAKYYNEAHGVLYVIDISDEPREEESLVTLASIMNDGTLSERETPIVVVLNKLDLVSAAERGNRVRQMLARLDDLQTKGYVECTEGGEEIECRGDISTPVVHARRSINQQQEQEASLSRVSTDSKGCGLLRCWIVDPIFAGSMTMEGDRAMAERLVSALVRAVRQSSSRELLSSVALSVIPLKLGEGKSLSNLPPE